MDREQFKAEAIKNIKLIDLSPRNSFIKFVLVVFLIGVAILFVGYSLDAVLAKKNLRQIDEAFIEKKPDVMRVVAQHCMDSGVDLMDVGEMQICVDEQKSEMQSVHKKALTNSRLKRFLLLAFTIALLATYVAGLRKLAALRKQESNES